jgi:hypothetical protein
MGMVCTSGLTKEFIEGHGLIIKCMARVISVGLMAGNTKETTLMTRKVDMEFLYGQIIESMKAIG